MRYVCSYCHTPVEAQADDEHKVCSNCGAEAGIEPVKDETPPAMRYFGTVLALAAIAALGGSLVSLGG